MPGSVGGSGGGSGAGGGSGSGTSAAMPTKLPTGPDLAAIMRAMAAYARPQPDAPDLHPMT